jgi:transcriptional regulator with XRE-family HTH domain
MTNLQEIIGRVIRQERQVRHLTIKQLGEKAGISEIYMGEIERGQKYPSANVLESLARALDLDLAEMLELMAEEIRKQREPQLTTVIGFTTPIPGQGRRTVVKQIVNMLNDGDVESVANFSAFLLSKHLTF